MKMEKIKQIVEEVISSLEEEQIHMIIDRSIFANGSWGYCRLDLGIKIIVLKIEFLRAIFCADKEGKQ